MLGIVALAKFPLRSSRPGAMGPFLLFVALSFPPHPTDRVLFAGFYTVLPSHFFGCWHSSSEPWAAVTPAHLTTKVRRGGARHHSPVPPLPWPLTPPLHSAACHPPVPSRAWLLLLFYQVLQRARHRVVSHRPTPPLGSFMEAYVG